MYCLSRLGVFILLMSTMGCYGISPTYSAISTGLQVLSAFVPVMPDERANQMRLDLARQAKAEDWSPEYLATQMTNLEDTIAFTQRQDADRERAYHRARKDLDANTLPLREPEVIRVEGIGLDDFFDGPSPWEIENMTQAQQLELINKRRLKAGQKPFKIENGQMVRDTGEPESYGPSVHPFSKNGKVLPWRSTVLLENIKYERGYDRCFYAGSAGYWAYCGLVYKEALGYFEMALSEPSSGLFKRSDADDEHIVFMAMCCCVRLDDKEGFLKYLTLLALDDKYPNFSFFILENFNAFKKWKNDESYLKIKAKSSFKKRSTNRNDIYWDMGSTKDFEKDQVNQSFPLKSDIAKRFKYYFENGN